MESVADRRAEEAVLADLSLTDARALLDRFSSLVRESGSRDEAAAAQFIAARLRDWGVPHTLHEPELFLSVPKSASLEVRTPNRQVIRA